MTSRLLPVIAIVQNLRQEVLMHDPRNGLRQRELKFDDEELWTVLPEPVQQECRSLWRQMLAAVLNPSNRRQNERED
jgi:hypothetical protein